MIGRAKVWWWWLALSTETTLSYFVADRMKFASLVVILGGVGPSSLPHSFSLSLTLGGVPT